MTLTLLANLHYLMQKNKDIIAKIHLSTQIKWEIAYLFCVQGDSNGTINIW